MGCKVSARASQLQQSSFWLLVLLLLLLACRHRCEANYQQHNHHHRYPYKQRILDMRTSIVEALGLAGIPDITKANVSQAEYERAHNEYLTKLHHNREAAHQRSLFTLRPSDIESVATSRETFEDEGESSVKLQFQLNDDEEMKTTSASLNAGNCSLESTLLRLLLQHREHNSINEHFNGKLMELELRVYSEAAKTSTEAASQLLARRSLKAVNPSQLRWLQLELPTEEMHVLLEHHTQHQLQLFVQLLVVRPNKSKRLAKGFSVSEAALNLHLVCSRTNTRLKRSPRRGGGGGGVADQLWSIHKGRRTECKNSSSGPAKKCCRHEMNVNFKELEGFDFIIQPKTFDAGFCKGRCPPRYNPAHHHALLQSLIWKGDRSKAPRPCCAPSKLAELEILYFDENEPTKLKVSNWKDMRVLECACS